MTEKRTMTREARFLLEHPQMNDPERQQYERERRAAIDAGETVWLSDGQPNPVFSLFHHHKRVFSIEQDITQTSWGVYVEIEDSVNAGLGVMPGLGRVSLTQAVQAVEEIHFPTFPRLAIEA